MMPNIIVFALATICIEFANDVSSYEP